MKHTEWWQQNGLYQSVLYLMIETREGDTIKVRADGAKALIDVMEDYAERIELVAILQKYT